MRSCLRYLPFHTMPLTRSRAWSELDAPVYAHSYAAYTPMNADDKENHY